MARMQYFGDFDTNSTGSAPNSSKKIFPTVVLIATVRLGRLRTLGNKPVIAGEMKVCIAATIALTWLGRGT